MTSLAPPTSQLFKQFHSAETMTKLLPLAFALLAFFLVDMVAGHKACTYRWVNLKKDADSEDECREACATCMLLS